MLKIVTFTNLYPNSAQPRHGIFVEERLRHLLASGRVKAEIIAPVPWFPVASPRFGHYGTLAAVPREETRATGKVRHPRYPVIPKIGMNIAPYLMARWLQPAVRAAADRLGGNVVIDAHFLYPDGVAASMIGTRLGLPVVMTARGSDVNLFPDFPVPRRLILDAIERSAKVITVSSALRDRLIDLGAAAEQVVTLRNGVDATRFRPVDHQTMRRQLGINDPMLLTVGHLVDGKNHALIIDALAHLPEVRLTIIGDGPLRATLLDQVTRLGLGGRVQILDVMPQPELVNWYGSADVSVLASRTEGMPNVVLESLACGTPVVTTAVAGVDEIMTVPAAGTVLQTPTAGELAGAIERILRNPPDRSQIRHHAETLGWDQTVNGLLDVLQSASELQLS